MIYIHLFSQHFMVKGLAQGPDSCKLVVVGLELAINL